MRISFTKLLNGLRVYLKKFSIFVFVDWHMSMHMRISFTRLLNGLREYLKNFLYSSFMDQHMSMHMRISLLNGLRVYLKKKRFSIFVFHGLAHCKNYTPVIFVPICTPFF